MADKTPPVPEQATPVEDRALPAAPPQDATAEQPFAETNASADGPGLDDLVGRARHEYSRYRSLAPLMIGNALAFNGPARDSTGRPIPGTGAPVPRSHPMVAQWLADGMVEDLEASPAQA